MSIVELGQVKQHLVIEHDDDDQLLQGYIDAAEGFVGDYLRRDLGADYPQGLPAPVVSSVMILAARYYADREAAEMDDLPASIKMMLANYRVFL
ncbi:head-tail connector protein [Roseovarius sp. MMSF_3281]|uniref:head-tail connector protein n=1 Tax=Roseovarius sp. MMSF_3281 TaxID=3046694 RepID=UPI00273F964B|nr:head-tail connector protein [Roseovarius sp. MMSF_3281]